MLPERITFVALMSGSRAGGPETKSPFGSKLDILRSGFELQLMSEVIGVWDWKISLYDLNDFR